MCANLQAPSAPDPRGPPFGPPGGSRCRRFEAQQMILAAAAFGAAALAWLRATESNDDKRRTGYRKEREGGLLPN